MNPAPREQELPFTPYVNPNNMAERIFRFPNTSMRLRRQADVIGVSLTDKDPSINFSSLLTDPSDSFFEITIEASHSTDWMSSSGEELGTQRQEYVFRRLGEVSLD